MSNTQQRWVKILPSAVESKYSGNILKSGDIHKVDWQYSDGCFVIFSHDQRFGTIHIEHEHVQEVYVYDEPRELPATEPYRIAELEARVKALEEKQEVTHRLASQAVLGSQPATYHEVKHDVEAQIGKTQPPRDLVKQESNLDKAWRLYPKGTGFKTLGTVAHTIVSSGEFKEEKRGIYDSNTKHYVLLDGQWADIVQDDNGG